MEWWNSPTTCAKAKQVAQKKIPFSAIALASNARKRLFKFLFFSARLKHNFSKRLTLILNNKISLRPGKETFYVRGNTKFLLFSFLIWLRLG
jgi:hypothetical protein